MSPGAVLFVLRHRPTFFIYLLSCHILNKRSTIRYSMVKDPEKAARKAAKSAARQARVAEKRQAKITRLEAKLERKAAKRKYKDEVAMKKSQIQSYRQPSKVGPAIKKAGAAAVPALKKAGTNAAKRIETAGRKSESYQKSESVKRDNSFYTGTKSKVKDPLFERPKSTKQNRNDVFNGMFGKI